MLRFLIAIATMVASPLTATERSPMYSDLQLSNYYKLFRDVERSYLNDYIIPNVPPPHRDAAAQIQLYYDDRGSNPLATYADPAERRVWMPMETMLFLHDVFTLQRWFWKNECQEPYILTYLWQALNQELDVPAPFVAFDIDPDRALAAMPEIAQGNEPLTTVTLFLLAHEVGHVVLGHAPDRSGLTAEADEAAADAFALDRLRDSGYGFGGMLAAYFRVAVFLDGEGMTRADGVHPASQARLTSLADRIAAAAAGDPSRSRQAMLEADDIRSIAGLSDPEAAAALGRQLREEFPANRLAASCVKP